MRNSKIASSTVPEKASRLLFIFAIALAIIAIRVWYIGIIQHSAKVQQARHPAVRTQIEKPARAAIFDCFGNPLAINRARFDVSIIYSDIRQIPRFEWSVDGKGNKIKIYKRKQYIHTLSQKLAPWLQMQAETIEELISSRASLLGSIPLVIKRGISEENYYKLKMLQMECIGLCTHQSFTRYYPQERSSCDILGFMGAISRDQWDKVTLEMRLLRRFMSAVDEGAEPELPANFTSIREVAHRLAELEKKAYSLSDTVGKSGVEKQFEDQLRGTFGKKNFLVDAKGNILEQLPSSRAKENGQRLDLTISSELQFFAEKLLAEAEEKIPLSAATSQPNNPWPPLAPWIRGSSVIAIDPNTGAILALASYPRFDPNDFCSTGIQKDHTIPWLESKAHIADLWNGVQELKRERLNSQNCLVDESCPLNLSNYLALTFPTSSNVLKTFLRHATLKEALHIQQAAHILLKPFENTPIEPCQIIDHFYGSKKYQAIDNHLLNQKSIAVDPTLLAPYFISLSTVQEKLLLLDLYRLFVDASRFSDCLQNHVANRSLNEFRDFERAICLLDNWMKKATLPLFREIYFRPWQQKNGSIFIKKVRIDEKQRRQQPKPQIDLFDELQKKAWATFLQNRRLELLFNLATNTTPDSKQQALFTKHLFEQLQKDSKTNTSLEKAYETLRIALRTLPKKISIEYLQATRSFEELNGMLWSHSPKMRGGGLLKTEQDLAMAFYPRGGFGYGRSFAYRQPVPVGSIFKLIVAYTALMERHKAGLDLNPLTIVDDKRQVGKTWVVGYTMDGKPIWRNYRGGLLPRTDHWAVGKIDIVGAIAASSNPYFSLLASDVLSDPMLLNEAAALFGYGQKSGIDLPAEEKGNLANDISYNRTGLYAYAIGQHTLLGTPLQSARMLAAIANGGKLIVPHIAKGETIIERQIPLPPEIQNILIEGLKESVLGAHGTARHELKQSYLQGSKIIGKTSTAEIMKTISLDPLQGLTKVKYTAFGAIAYDANDKPELVVVSFICFGDYGRKLAPLNMKMIEKYRELKRHTT